ncbi:hypothetical protein P2318_01770 [Myxococcaceae bacterium GXIMD 01537]
MGLAYVDRLLQEECDEIEAFCRRRNLYAKTWYQPSVSPDSDPRRFNQMLLPDEVASAVKTWLRTVQILGIDVDWYLERVLPTK